MYRRQPLLGLEYLHKNRIVHRDIKGANILVDNKGCIKLADFGASKKVVELVTINGAKSMKGTPYWMAPEVILQTEHSFSADIWSVGCTVIEMAIGKPPWSQQYQEVAALFHIGTTKSHPPILEHLSFEAKEPGLRPSASDLLQEHGNLVMTFGNLMSSINSEIRSTCIGLKDVCEMGSLRCSTVYLGKLSEPGSYWRASSCDDDMCQTDDKYDLEFCASAKLKLLAVLECLVRRMISLFHVDHQQVMMMMMMMKLRSQRLEPSWMKSSRTEEATISSVRRVLQHIEWQSSNSCWNCKQ